MRPCDKHPDFNIKGPPQPKPRRVPELDQEYNSLTCELVFSPSGALVGYRPKASTTQAPPTK